MKLSPKTYIPLAAIILFVGAFIFYFPAKLWIFPYMHDLTQKKLSSTLTSIPLPNKTEKIGELSEVGQLSGNSDHCDYFTALLMKTDLSKSEFENYYKNKYLGNSYLDFFWLNESNSTSTKQNHLSLHPLEAWFSTRPQSDQTNVVVYIYDSGITSSIDRRCS